jgi:dTDP-glucose pyrophosphorylase
VINLIPMAGRGSRFGAEGYAVPKPFIPVLDKPMFMSAVHALPRADSYILICQERFAQRYSFAQMLDQVLPGCTLLTVDHVTEGQACTCLLAEDLLTPDVPLTISACDYLLVYDNERFQALMDDSSVDVLLWTFRIGSMPVSNFNAYAYCRTENGRVVEVVEKATISDEPRHDPAVVGTFTYRQSQDFIRGARRMIEKGLRVNNEFHVATSINQLIAEGKNVVAFDVDKFVCLGDPFDLLMFQAWEDFFYHEPNHPYNGIG